ncbi:MAG TPA: hypothetical protein PLM53_20490 [Spirochaetota bacterium]|nr:hypothetical protein [Spirochaetota bacterium]HPC43190.1 hypothetical protein [Spirochaetota bacterium]HPL15473.1 hypothetical protein [Spirochaetota bacterium]HQF10487.1 hypothetical protein [Spirochaetota bacterium]HQH99475.1 hypothetical protein [Spirochaetota bacterium]
MADPQITEKPDRKPAKPKGIIFAIVSAAAFIVIPAAAIAAIIITILLQPDFYTGVLKDGKFITAFVEAKSWQVEKDITDEIERDVQITQYTKEYEAIKSQYEQAKEEYSRISRDDEMEALKKQRGELKSLKWKDVKDTFPDEKSFEKNREEELKNIKERITAIEEYQDQNSDRIKTAKKTMKKALGEYEDALSTLEDKKKDAEKIAEKHRNTLTGKLYADLERIEGPLTKILNDRLIDKAVRSEIEKVLRFLTSYDSQIEQRNIYYARIREGEGLTGRSLRVRFPDIAISLWVEDDSKGAPKRKHVLSQMMVEELDRIDSLENKVLLKTLFRLSDTSLGEYFTGKYLKKLGLTIDGGVIRLANFTLKDEKAEIVSDVMEYLSWGQYAVYGAAGLLVLFVLYLVFSTVERGRKLAMLKRLFIYPSLLVLLACGAFVVASRNIFSYYPDFIQDLSVRSYVKHLSFTAAWHFIMPMLILFGTLFVTGLIIRKLLAGKASRA